jgi:hypothetical protein
MYFYISQFSLHALIFGPQTPTACVRRSCTNLKFVVRLPLIILCANVSFNPPFSLTKKYYNAIKTIRFNGVTMDKLTYAVLKGLGADLSTVTLI